MSKRRTHILLEPEQQEALANIANREGRSISDLTREIVQEGIQQRQQAYASAKKQRLQALERARQVRQAILDDHGGIPLQLNLPEIIAELRDERDAQFINRRD